MTGPNPYNVIITDVYLTCKKLNKNIHLFQSPLAGIGISESEDDPQTSNCHSPLSVGCRGTSNHPTRIASQPSIVVRSSKLQSSAAPFSCTFWTIWTKLPLDHKGLTRWCIQRIVGRIRIWTISLHFPSAVSRPSKVTEACFQSILNTFCLQMTDVPRNKSMPM